MKTKNQPIRIACALWAASLTACTGFLEIDAPRNQLAATSIFANDELANGAVAGIYFEMKEGRGSHFANGGSGSVTNLMGIASDELDYNLGVANVQAFAANDWLTDNTMVYNLWASAYKSIFRANEVLEGLRASPSVSPTLALQLEGEARFIRAFCHFYLVDLFGPVPVSTTNDYRTTKSLPRSDEREVFNAIEQDLVAAQALLPADYSHAFGERVRPNRWAATQLLARLKLYQGEWAAAVDYATEVIGQNGQYELVGNPDSVFLKNSSEAVWQLFTVEGSTETNEALAVVPRDGQPTPPAYSLSTALLDRFENGDWRKTHWTNVFVRGADGIAYVYPYKFKIRTKVYTEEPKEYSMVLRLAECFLIRAEALVEQGDVTAALDDINALRVKRGLPPLVGLTAEQVATCVENERFVEFFYEWGHRWFDLKRWGRNDRLLPIPHRESEANPFLTQNDPYQ